MQENPSSTRTDKLRRQKVFSNEEEVRRKRPRRSLFSRSLVCQAGRRQHYKECQIANLF